MANTYKFYKDKEKARESRNKHRKKNYQQTQGSAFSKREKWSEEEIELILKSELSDREISKKIGRSVEAIQVKRCKIKAKINKETA